MDLQEVKHIQRLVEKANNRVAILYANKIIPHDLCICFITDTVQNYKLTPYLTFSHNSKSSFSEIYTFLSPYMSYDIMRNIKLPQNNI